MFFCMCYGGILVDYSYLLLYLLVCFVTLGPAAGCVSRFSEGWEKDGLWRSVFCSGAGVSQDEVRVEI